MGIQICLRRCQGQRVILLPLCRQSFLGAGVQRSIPKTPWNESQFSLEIDYVEIQAWILFFIDLIANRMGLSAVDQPMECGLAKFQSGNLRDR